MRKMIFGVLGVWLAIAGAAWIAAYMGITSVKEAKMPADARARVYMQPFPREADIHPKEGEQ